MLNLGGGTNLNSKSSSSSSSSKEFGDFKDDSSQGKENLYLDNSRSSSDLNLNLNTDLTPLMGPQGRPKNTLEKRENLFTETETNLTTQT